MLYVIPMPLIVELNFLLVFSEDTSLHIHCAPNKLIILKFEMLISSTDLHEYHEYNGESVSAIAAKQRSKGTPHVFMKSKTLN